MTVFQHPNGYWGFNFMYKGNRQNHTFKGLSKKEVEAKEMECKLSLMNNTPFSTATTLYTWEDGVRDYKVYAETNYTRKTECLYVIENFGKIVQGMYLKDIKPRHIEEYIATRVDFVKASTINRELNTIRRLFSLAFDNDYIDKNPCRKIKNLRIKNPPERFLAISEQTKLLKKCNPIMKLIVLVAIYSGLRKNELLHLKWVDVNFNEKYLIARETKNNTVREVPLCEPLVKVLKKIPHIGEYVFTNPRTMQPYKDVYSSFSRAVIRAKIPHITFHQLRHTTASRLNELGVDIVTIQEILGHANINTTRKYTHNSRVNKINAMNKLGEY